MTRIADQEVTVGPIKAWNALWRLTDCRHVRRQTSRTVLEADAGAAGPTIGPVPLHLEIHGRVMFQTGSTGEKRVVNKKLPTGSIFLHIRAALPDRSLLRRW
jgi:hypothetical protein